jgi:hypothetical protein
MKKYILKALIFFTAILGLKSFQTQISSEDLLKQLENNINAFDSPEVEMMAVDYELRSEQKV